MTAQSKRVVVQVGESAGNLRALTTMSLSAACPDAVAFHQSRTTWSSAWVRRSNLTTTGCGWPDWNDLQGVKPVGASSAGIRSGDISIRKTFSERSVSNWLVKILVCCAAAYTMPPGVKSPRIVIESEVCASGPDEPPSFIPPIRTMGSTWNCGAPACFVHRRRRCRCSS